MTLAEAPTSHWKPFSPKQREAIIGTDARINLFDGPVRAGKTIAQLFRWIRHLKETPHPNLLITGQTKDTVKRNILEDLFDLFDTVGIRYSYNQSEGTIKALGTTGYIVGTNDEKAERKIRGLTIGGWLADEITLTPETAVNMALTRMSPEGSRAFWTTNPDSPYHFIYQDYVKDALEHGPKSASGFLKRIGFKLGDNLSLGEEYIEFLKTQFHGLWYERFIEGLWVAAEGVIWSAFDPARHIVRDLPLRFRRVVVGVDYGTATVTCFLALGETYDGKWYVFREYYHDAERSMGQKTDSQFADDFEMFLADGPDHFGAVDYDSIEVDPSAASFRHELRQRGFSKLRGADNEVLDGVRNVGDGFALNDLYIYSECKKTAEQVATYAWDPKAQERGEDKPLKMNDHAADSLRYALKRYYGRPILKAVDKAPGW